MQRKQIRLAKAVLEDKIDPQAYFGPAQLAQDIKRTSDRLETAADDALETKQHSSLASLSGALIRAHELRGKLGGSIRDAGEVNFTITLGELHQRLDGILGTDQGDRHAAARSLLGLAADAPGPRRSRTITNPDDPTNPVGAPLTIDADVVPSSRVRVRSANPVLQSCGRELCAVLCATMPAVEQPSFEGLLWAPLWCERAGYWLAPNAPSNEGASSRAIKRNINGLLKKGPVRSIRLRCL